MEENYNIARTLFILLNVFIIWLFYLKNLRSLNTRRKWKKERKIGNDLEIALVYRIRILLKALETSKNILLQKGFADECFLSFCACYGIFDVCVGLILFVWFLNLHTVYVALFVTVFILLIRYTNNVYFCSNISMRLAYWKYRQSQKLKGSDKNRLLM